MFSGDNGITFKHILCMKKCRSAGSVSVQGILRVLVLNLKGVFTSSVDNVGYRSSSTSTKRGRERRKGEFHQIPFPTHKHKNF